MFQTKRDIDKHVRAFLSKLRHDDEVSKAWYRQADREKKIERKRNCCNCCLTILIGKDFVICSSCDWKSAFSMMTFGIYRKLHLPNAHNEAIMKCGCVRKRRKSLRISMKVYWLDIDWSFANDHLFVCVRACVCCSMDRTNDVCIGICDSANVTSNNNNFAVDVLRTLFAVFRLYWSAHSLHMNVYLCFKMIFYTFSWRFDSFSMEYFFSKSLGK